MFSSLSFDVVLFRISIVSSGASLQLVTLTAIGFEKVLIANDVNLSAKDIVIFFDT